ncbi:hypothetical protein C9374_005306 [Naegleria lovaniensis]|uniref:Ankyrin repeat protein n=1 Tax=Naegleria lovaniensis TaxID=51637 RepID=A0AA88GKN0_NAELO|nr:uncharacterized protein C9374_005306 [Naegleria lovaniensis]KAG2382726.1 hypothetical protein C9374_005306 [Naegleria lovaniensis]
MKRPPLLEQYTALGDFSSIFHHFNHHVEHQLEFKTYLKTMIKNRPSTPPRDGLKINEMDYHLIEIASMYGHLEILKYLISLFHDDDEEEEEACLMNSKLTITACLMNQALMTACQFNQIEIIEYIMTHIDPKDIQYSVYDSETGSNGLTIVNALRTGNFEMVRAFYNRSKFRPHKPCLIYRPDRPKFWKTYYPLWLACQSGNEKVVKFLIEEGADVTELSGDEYIPEEKQSALSVCLWLGYDDLVDIIVENADTDYVDDYLCNLQENEGVVDILIESTKRVEMKQRLKDQFKWTLFNARELLNHDITIESFKGNAISLVEGF